jgi:hypothetical protein
MMRSFETIWRATPNKLRGLRSFAAGLSGVAVCVILAGGSAQADRIRNPVAVFAGLDKITGRIISFEVTIDETVQFGSLQLTPRVCWTRPQNEQPQTTSFVEVDEVTFDNQYRRIFGGWMYAASPGLHGVEHAVYDVWVTDCKGGTDRDLVAEPKEPDAPPANATPRDRPRAATGAAGSAPAIRPAVNPNQRLDVAPPQGVPVQPAQRPTQRFFPVTPNSLSDPGRGGGN